MKDLADSPSHIINSTSPFFRREQPERGIALWIQINDQDSFVVICSQAGTNVDGIRRLADTPLEIDKRNDLAHLASVGLRGVAQPNRSIASGRAKTLKPSRSQQPHSDKILPPASSTDVMRLVFYPEIYSEIERLETRR
jgi:hypothetical protein